MPRRTLFVANPNAGSGAAAEIRQMAEARPDVEVVAAASPDEAARVIAAARDRRRVVVAGGDGTIHHAVNALAPDFAVELGIIAAGTGNDLARSLGLPLDGHAAAAAVAFDGRARPVDLIRTRGPAGERIAVNACTGGFGARVAENVAGATKEKIGAWAYVVAAGQALPGLQEHRARIEFHDGAVDVFDTVQLFVANGATVAGGVPVAPSARVDDGLLELVVVRAQPLAALALLAARVAAGTHLDDPGVFARASRSVRIEADPPLPFSVDGEPFGETPLTFELLPGALRVAT